MPQYCVHVFQSLFCEIRINEYFQNYILSKILIMFTKEYGTENVGKSYMFKTL